MNTERPEKEPEFPLWLDTLGVAGFVTFVGSELAPDLPKRRALKAIGLLMVAPLLRRTLQYNSYHKPDLFGLELDTPSAR